MVLPNYEERTWVEAGSDILRDPERSFGIAQVLAETIVEAPWASPAVLAEAEQAVRRAAVGDPDEPSYRDLTSVFVEHRGDLEGAVVLRRDAYRRQPTRWRANHLIRVELLLLERRGEPARFDLPTGRPPSGDAEVWVEIESGLVEGCDVHLTAVIGELAFGFLRIRGVTGTDRTLRFALADDERLLQAQWVETSRECGAADLGDLLVEFWIL
jgi:hypothetical protein